MIAKKPKLLLLTAVLGICLTSCGSVPAVPETPSWSEEEQIFFFPGTEWGMTEAEWMDAWSLEEADCQREVLDAAAKAEGSEESVVWHLKEKVKIWDCPADLSVSFAKFPNEEPILVDVKAVFDQEHEEAVVKAAQEAFHASSAGYNQIVSSPGKVSDLSQEQQAGVYALYEAWGRDVFPLETFGMTFFTWAWEEGAQSLTLECSGIPAAALHLLESKE